MSFFAASSARANFGRVIGSRVHFVRPVRAYAAEPASVGVRRFIELGNHKTIRPRPRDRHFETAGQNFACLIGALH
jgi:hypothetical protein